MTSPYKDRSGFLFISGSVYRRVPLFRSRKACHVFLRTLDAYRSKYDFRVHAYVVMPDHYHLLLWLPKQVRLTDVLRDFKSMVSKRIVEWLREEDRHRLLKQLELKRSPARFKDARYCVLQHNNYVKEFEGDKILWQKVDYIHLNPVREGLAERPEEYLYSSARAYRHGGADLVEVAPLD